MTLALHSLTKHSEYGLSNETKTTSINCKDNNNINIDLLLINNTPTENTNNPKNTNNLIIKKIPSNEEGIPTIIKERMFL